MKTSQALAAQVIARVLAGRTLDKSLGHAWRVADLDPGARSLTQELCYGTLRHLGALRAMVQPLLTRPATDPQLEALLWVAFYQLQHGSSAEHAVVSNAVDAAALLKITSAKGLVNAVLRYYLRNREDVEGRATLSEEALYSYPQWWIELVRNEYPKQWKAILQTGNMRPPMTLRANRRKCVRDGELRLMAEAGITCRPIGADGIVIEDPRNVLALPGFAEGRLSVQDYGAQLAAPFLSAEDGMRVLDACAAPGGKTTHILELSKCALTALDRDERRVGKIEENLKRLELYAHVRAADAADVAAWWDGERFDRILADVPCTASGVVRRHPDGKWLRRAGDVEQFARQQRRLLSALWPVLKPGGRLLYTTCSVFEGENEALVGELISAHGDALRCPLPWPAGVATSGKGQLLPAGGAAEDNHDGFFYALLEKRGG